MKLIQMKNLINEVLKNRKELDGKYNGAVNIYSEYNELNKWLDSNINESSYFKKFYESRVKQLDEDIKAYKHYNNEKLVMETEKKKQELIDEASYRFKKETKEKKEKLLKLDKNLTNLKNLFSEMLELFDSLGNENINVDPIFNVFSPNSRMVKIFMARFYRERVGNSRKKFESLRNKIEHNPIFIKYRNMCVFNSTGYGEINGSKAGSFNDLMRASVSFFNDVVLYRKKSDDFSKNTSNTDNVNVVLKKFDDLSKDKDVGFLLNKEKYVKIYKFINTSKMKYAEYDDLKTKVDALDKVISSLNNDYTHYKKSIDYLNKMRSIYYKKLSIIEKEKEQLDEVVNNFRSILNTVDGIGHYARIYALILELNEDKKKNAKIIIQEEMEISTTISHYELSEKQIEEAVKIGESIYNRNKCLRIQESEEKRQRIFLNGMNRSYEDYCDDISRKSYDKYCQEIYREMQSEGWEANVPNIGDPDEISRMEVEAFINEVKKRLDAKLGKFTK